MNCISSKGLGWGGNHPKWHQCHMREWAQDTLTTDLWGRVGGWGDTGSARRKEGRAQERTGWRLLCAPFKEVTPEVDIVVLKCCRWGRVCWYGASAWKHLANGEGHCPPLCGLDTEQCHSETGTIRGIRWYILPRERKGE